jgi:threonine dehydratase
MQTGHQALPGIEDVRAAAERLRGLIVDTRLVESPALNERFGARILFKPEILQRTGSFKFRGAYNKISIIPAEERRRGVVAFSSGNHAQGVAASAAMFGVEAVIAMPHDAPAIKSTTSVDGRQNCPHDRFGEDRNGGSQPLYRSAGHRLCPAVRRSRNHRRPGTIGWSWWRKRPNSASTSMPWSFRAAAGVFPAASRLPSRPYHRTPKWVAEPEHFDDTKRSLASGERVSNEAGHRSICDAILTTEPGALTFAINRNTLAGGVAVTDKATAAAMRDAATYLKLVVQPGGAVAFAALSSGEIDLAGKCIAVVLSGGNADLGRYAEIIASC